MSADPFDARAQHLLKVLVDRYIASGLPVPSRAVAEDSELRVSSATVRNVMAVLESQGLVTSPHTSAGKVPTPRGLRFFVDSLLAVRPLEADVLDTLREELDPDVTTVPDLVDRASRMLSEVSSMAGLVTLPRQTVNTLRQVEFLPLPNRRVLVILVLNDREVQNRIIRTEREYAQEELVRAANYVNEHFGGQSPAHIRRRLLEGMRDDRDRMDRLMQLSLEMAASAFAEDDGGAAGDYVVAGQTNLLAADTGESLDAVRQLFEAFQQKREILDLLDRSLRADGVQLFIGREAGVEVFEGYSVVTAPYEVDGHVAGALGVIGPTRMDYEHVIPLVDVTARLLGAAMTGAPADLSPDPRGPAGP